MSLLVAVEVQGIRSVGTGVRNAVVIDFLSPLTVICGSNGAGKTVCKSLSAKIIYKNSN